MNARRHWKLPGTWPHSTPRCLLTVLAAVLLATSALAADSYRWQDPETGQLIYSPTPPTDPDQPYVQLRDGQVIRSFEGSERFEQPDSERELERRAAEAQRKSDALLLLKYKRIEDIDEAMEAELDNLRYDFNLLDGTYESLEKSLFEQIGLAADRQRAGLPVATHQADQLESIRSRMAENREDRKTLVAREEAIRTEFAGTRERYQSLLDNQPGMQR